MDFRLLGPLEVWDGARELHVSGRRERCVLAVLLVNADRVVPVDRLIDVLWPEEPPDAALNTLQVFVTRVRRSLEPEREQRAPGQVLVTRAPGYVLRVGGNSDVFRFEKLAEEGRRLRESSPAEASEVLRSALREWRGDPLDEFATMPYAVAERNRLMERRLAVLEQRIDAELAAGAHADVVGELETLVAAHPLREGLCASLMTALYRCGRQADALRAYSDTREQLVEQLGIDPSPRLRALERAILVQDPSLAAPSAAPTAAVPTGGSRAGHRVGTDLSLDVRARHGREIVPILGDSANIGRDLSNDLVLAGDARASRHHASLRQVGGSWEIADLGSSNGTFVNGERLRSPRVLVDGDEIRIGEATLRVVLASPEMATLQEPQAHEP